MLPQYVEKQLTLNMLTDDIVNTALETGDYEGISTETARQACYQWMSHSAVWNEELAQFTAEYCQSTDSEPDDLQVLDVIADISNEIERLLVNEAVIEYRKKHIHDESVVQAMEKSGVLADVVDMSALLASLAVGGKQEVEDNCEPLLEENNLTVADVIKVADAYQVEYAKQPVVTIGFTDDCELTEFTALVARKAMEEDGVLNADKVQERLEQVMRNIKKSAAEAGKNVEPDVVMIRALNTLFPCAWEFPKPVFTINFDALDEEDE